MKKIYSVDVEVHKFLFGKWAGETWANVWIYRRDKNDDIFSKKYKIKSSQQLIRARKMQDAILKI